MILLAETNQNNHEDMNDLTDLKLFKKLECGANFGHQYCFLAVIFYQVQDQYLLLVLISVCYQISNVSLGFPCVTCNTRRIHNVDGLTYKHTYIHTCNFIE